MLWRFTENENIFYFFYDSIKQIQYWRNIYCFYIILQIRGVTLLGLSAELRFAGGLFLCKKRAGKTPHSFTYHEFDLNSF
jgi:hypothetical protein